MIRGYTVNLPSPGLHINDYWIHDHMLVPEVNAWSSVNLMTVLDLAE